MLAKGSASTLFPRSPARLRYHFMIAAKDSFPLSRPASRRIYRPGQIHPEIRVPLREVQLSDPHQPVRLYDTSGPWGDEQFAGHVAEGLPLHRESWIRARNDVVEYERG